MKTKNTYITLLFIFCACPLFFLSCGKSGTPAAIKADPQIIASFTGGTVSTKSRIIVSFVDYIVTDSEVDVPLKQNLMEIEPGLKGKTSWKDRRTLVFEPENRMPSGKTFNVRVKLSEFMEVPKNFTTFSFQFATMRQSINLVLEGWKVNNPEQMTSPDYTGTMTCADLAETADIETMLTATQNNQKLTIEWIHDANGLSHSFTIKDITRTEKAQELKIAWDGGRIGAGEKGNRTITIPPLNAFYVLAVQPVQGNTQYISIQFSDPVKERQDLNGLIRVTNIQSLRYEINGNYIYVYNNYSWPAEAEIQIAQGIQNAMGERLAEEKKTRLVFQTLKPEVRFTGKGVIVPTQEGITVPIETVNLSAIRVEVMKLFENNIGQFLQINNLDGDKELHRVGRVIWRKVMPVNYTPEQRNQWIRTGLDLSPLVKDDMKGLYRISLSFDRRHVEYDCARLTAEEIRKFKLDEWETNYLQTVNDSETGQVEQSNWDYYDSDYYDNYNNRKNPCHPAYYRKYYDHNVVVYRNFLVSDIGLIARKGIDDTLVVAASDLKTAGPLGNVKLTVLNYQLQAIGNGTTDSSGLAKIQLSAAPYLITAEKDKQAGYLKVNNANALSTSHFDAGGEVVKKGIKGLIYTERGVWRPGDAIYLTFILEDKQQKLPADHPVIFQLFNPQGQLIQTKTLTRSVGGFYHFPTQTESTAPTGVWTARINVGGVVFEKWLKIETVKPNRLKIELDFGKDRKALKSETIAGNVTVKWLHGAIASGMNTDISLRLEPGRTAFSKYSAFIFDNPLLSYQPEGHAIFTGTLDEQGKVQFSSRIYSRSNAPGMLTAHFKTRVFEPGGDISTDVYSLPFHPYEQYVGIKVPPGDKSRGMLLTDTTHTVDIVLVDADEKPVTSGEVTAEIYKLNWRWWWETGQDKIADYLQNESISSLQSGKVAIQDGRGAWTFQIKYPDWGRYFIRVADNYGGHATGKVVYIDWPGWAGRPQSEGAGGAAILTMSADKQKYQTGEKVTLTIPSQQNSHILIALEANGQVLSSEWIRGQAEQTLYEFKATPHMTPTLYTHVTLVQPHLQTANDKPIRLYGVMPLLIEDPVTHLKPVITCKDVFAPESREEIVISEADGRPMTYTIAMVDEGLLSLTRFSVPNPWQHFYKKEALAVKTWDLYDYVAAAYGGRLEQLLAIGGSDEATPPESQKAKRFPPVVKFLGPFELGKNKRQSHQIDIPRYVGAVRVMVVAGYRGAYGAVEKEVQVKKPLMVLTTLPRVMSIQEDVGMPVSVFALEEQVKQVVVRAEASGQLYLSGEAVQTVNFGSPGDALVKFRLKARPVPGMAKIVVTAEGGGVKAVDTIEIDVRAPNEPVTDVISAMVSGNNKWEKTVTYPGIAGTNTVQLEVSRLPPLNLGKRLQFLVHYPHGCVEQTTSSVFPQLYLNKLLELPRERSDEIQRNIEAGIERLISFQTATGGFGYWPGDSAVNDWGSSYAGHFLIEAEKAGYVIPFYLKENWLNYQYTAAEQWTEGPDYGKLIQTYRLFTLALAGKPALGAMNRLREKGNLAPEVKYRLAAAYHLAGQKEEAKRLIFGALPIIRVYQELSQTFGSDLRDKAMLLEALVLMEEYGKAEPLIKELSAELASDKWLSTQTTAYTLLAFAKYAGVSAQSQEMRFRFSWQGQTAETVTSTKPLAQLKLKTGQEAQGQFSFENLSGFNLYTALIVHGSPALGQETAASNGLSMGVGYYLAGGEPLGDGYVSLNQGEDFMVTVSVTNTGTRGIYQELALSLVFPSGWEINNTRLHPGGDRPAATYSPFKYQDIRDDRVYFYFDLGQGETKTYNVQLNASYLGRFYLPLFKVEAMYDEKINARVKGTWVEVK